MKLCFLELLAGDPKFRKKECCDGSLTWSCSFSSGYALRSNLRRQCTHPQYWRALVRRTRDPKMYRFKFHHGFIGRYISDIWGYDVFCHCWCAQLPAFVQNLGPSMWRGKFDNEAVAMTAIVMTWLPWKSWALLVPDPIGCFDVGMEWQYCSYWCLVMDGLLGECDDYW
jgi:hypothetical protein